MNLSEISRRTGIAPRRLRYAIYHVLVPGVERADLGRGWERHFTAFEAFGIAVAAKLLESGVKREVVAAALEALVGRYGRETPQSKIPLWRGFSLTGRLATCLELFVGDGRYFRLRGTASAGRGSFDSGWIPGSGQPALAEPFMPVVLVTANLLPLLRAIGHD
jgi:hypothetical protein